MSGLPTHLLPENIELSIVKFLNDKWAGGCGYPVYFDDAYADPATDASILKWAEFSLLRNGTARRQSSLCQIDFYHRVGDKSIQQTTGARLNVEVTKMVGAFQNALTPFTQGFRVYDFSGVTKDTPNASPTVTNGWLQIATGAGQLGFTDPPRRMPTLAGLRRQSVSFRVLHVQDRPYSQVYG